MPQQQNVHDCHCEEAADDAAIAPATQMLFEIAALRSQMTERQAAFFKSHPITDIIKRRESLISE